MQPAGTVTDDTDLALCIARTLAELKDFDRADIADQVHEWCENDSFDIGQMTADAIREYVNETSWRDVGREV